MERLAGSRFGSFEILDLLGRGGMGEVYRARDTELERTVAIKVLPSEVARDSDRLIRFRREAQLLAALNHPNIAAIYGLVDHEMRRGLVLELVEGPTLADRIATGPLPIGDALSIAKQIADALEAAHEQGIVHRDLKPSNIKVTPAGTVKVLDFGLAKAEAANRSDRDLTHSPTVAFGPTVYGVLLGTAPYMSPEQARGKPVDKRTDIWAFGCVVYEMLTGRRAFAGDTATDTLAAILERDPDWAAVPASTPPGIQRLLRRCLEKDVTRRLRDIGEARIVIADAIAASSKMGYGPFFYAVAAVAILAIVVAGGWVLSRRERPRTAGPTEYVPLTNFADSAVSPSLSPDGRMLTFIRGESTFAGPGQVYVKLLPDGEPVQLTDDDYSKMSPVFSPDGSRIAYTATGAGGGWNWSTWVVPVLGGQARPLLANASGLTWIDGAGPPRVMFSALTGKGIHMAILTASESRAASRDVYVPAGQNGMAHRSRASPDGAWVLVSEMDASTWLPCRVVPVDGRDQGKPVGPVPAQCTDVAWSADGRWMYVSANTGSGFHVWRQRFSDGAAEQVTFGAAEEEGIALPRDGQSLITSIGSSQSTVWVHDSRGERQISSQGYGFLPSFSADGRTLYYLLRSGGSRHFVSGELWVADLDSGQRQRLLPDFLVENYGISRDSRRVVFVMANAAGESPVWVASLDGRSPPRRLTTMNALRALFRNEHEVLFVAEDGGTRFLYRVKDDGTGLQKVVPDPIVFLYDVSPNGGSAAAWVGGSTEDTLNSVVVYSLEGGAATTICVRCASAGGPQRGRTPPVFSWSADGAFVYFVDRGPDASTYAVPVPSGRSLPVLPSSGIQSTRDIVGLAGVRRIAPQAVFAGPNPSTFAFSKVTTQRNIYRVPLP